MKSRKGKGTLLIAAVVLGLAFFSCAPVHCPPARPIVLTEEQKQVRIVPSTTDINRTLRQNCSVVAVVDECTDTALRIKTVENGGNVAETMCIATQSVTTYTQTGCYGNYRVYTPNTDNYTYSSAIIYKCPCELDLDQKP